MPQVNLNRPEDSDALEELQRITGIVNMSDLVRFVMRQTIRNMGAAPLPQDKREYAAARFYTTEDVQSTPPRHPVMAAAMDCIHTYGADSRSQ